MSQPCAASSASVFTRANASFAMTSDRLTQQLRHHAHRHVQPSRLGLQGNESVVPVERGSVLVLGIDDHRHRSDLVGMGQASVQGIQQQVLPESLDPGGLIHGKPAQQSDGQLRIAGQLAGEFVGQVGQGHNRGRQRVVAEDARVGRVHGDKWRGHALVRVLPRLLLEIAVERVGAAMKGGSVVLSTQGLDSDAGQCHPLCAGALAGSLAISLCCALEARIWLRRIEQGLHEGKLLFAR